MAMAQTPKDKCKLPKDVTERSDSEVMDLVLGKRVHKELDKKLQETESKGVPEFME